MVTWDHVNLEYFHKHCQVFSLIFISNIHIQSMVSVQLLLNIETFLEVFSTNQALPDSSIITLGYQAFRSQTKLVTFIP